MNIKRYIDMRVRQILRLMDESPVDRYIMALHGSYQKLNSISPAAATSDVKRASIRAQKLIKNAIDRLDVMRNPGLDADKYLPRESRVVGSDVVVWSHPKISFGAVIKDLALALRIMRDVRDVFTERGKHIEFTSIVDPIIFVLQQIQMNPR